jgi:DNA-binding transcriptional MerR regulator
MNDELSPREWISAKEASRILKVSERQVNYYGHQGQIKTKRAGRRVLYLATDVEQLARTLDVDIRPQNITRSDVNEQLARYVQQRSQVDQEISEAQKHIAERQQQILEEQKAASERLLRIEKYLAGPQPKQRGPSWQTITIALVVLAIALVVLAILVRLF